MRLYALLVVTVGVTSGDRGLLDWKNLRSLIAGRAVNIHVGAHFHDLKDESTTDFFIAFDPRWNMSLVNSTLTLPYIVVASPGYSHVPFHVHRRPTCSSTLEYWDESDQETYMKNARRACDAFTQARPPSEWIGWENHARQASTLKSMGPPGCFLCQRKVGVRRTEVLPAIGLITLVRGLRAPIKRLHIDAQGIDFSLIRSLGELITTVEEVKIECQLKKCASPKPLCVQICCLFAAPPPPGPYSQWQNQNTTPQSGTPRHPPSPVRTRRLTPTDRPRPLRTPGPVGAWPRDDRTSSLTRVRTLDPSQHRLCQQLDVPVDAARAAKRLRRRHPPAPAARLQADEAAD
eukprot:349177-Prymnesium_polylepis.1